MTDIIKSANDAATAAEILRVASEKSSDIRMILNGDYNFISSHGPEINKVSVKYILI